MVENSLKRINFKFVHVFLKSFATGTNHEIFFYGLNITGANFTGNCPVNSDRIADNDVETQGY